AALPRLCTRRALPRFSKRRASTVFTKAAFHGCREGVLVGEGSWRERGTRQGLKAPTYLGDQRGPEGPLFHGCAQSVLLHGLQKALLHGFRESVLVGKGSSRKSGAGRGLKAHRDWAMNAALKGRSSTVVHKACSSIVFE